MFTFLAGLAGKFKSYLIIAAVAAVLIGIALWYFNYSQNKINELNQTIAKLELAVQLQEKTIKKLQGVIEFTQNAADELSKKFNIIEKDASQLSKLFSEHDLNNLAEKKPGLIEKLVNDGTKKVLKHFEDISNPDRF